MPQDIRSSAYYAEMLGFEMTPKELEAVGVKVVSYPRMLSTAALKGMMNALAAFAPQIDADAPTPHPGLMVTFAELNKIMGLDRLNELEEKYK